MESTAAIHGGSLDFKPVRSLRLADQTVTGNLNPKRVGRILELSAAVGIEGIGRQFPVVVPVQTNCTVVQRVRRFVLVGGSVVLEGGHAIGWVEW